MEEGYTRNEIKIILNNKELFSEPSILEALFKAVYKKLNNGVYNDEMHRQLQQKYSGETDKLQYLLENYKMTSNRLLKGYTAEEINVALFSNLTLNDSKENTPEKIGVIFHWGIYSVPAYDSIKSARRRKTQNGSEWYKKRLLEKSDYRPISGYKETQQYHNEHFNGIQYDDFKDSFFPSYNKKVVQIWCNITKKINAKYMILTAKHHDGFCLWNTKTTDFKYKKGDLLLDFKNVVKENNMKFGIYFSLIEFGKPVTKEFLKDILSPQLIELSKYKPDYLWLDGHWDIKTQVATKTIVDIIEQYYKGVIINDRISKDENINKKLSSYRVYEDRYLPDQKQFSQWQHINTISLSWGYNRDQKDEDYKSGETLYKLYKQVIDKGGELLINFGPKADGTLDENEVKSILQFGKLLNA